MADHSLIELDQQQEKQNEMHERLATYTWIGSGILLLLLEEKFTLLSWQSLMFFIVGPFLAAVMLGWGFSRTHRGLAKVLALFGAQPSSEAEGELGVFGVAMTLFHAVIAFAVARYAVSLMT